MAIGPSIRCILEDFDVMHMSGLPVCLSLSSQSSVDSVMLQEDLPALERVATQNTVALLLLSKVLSNGKLEHVVSWDFSVHCCYPVLGLKKQ